MRESKAIRRITSVVLIAALLVSLLCLSGCGGDKKHSGNIVIFAASSLKEPIEEVASLYTANYPDVNITVNTEGSSTLQTQIEHGADCDIFIPAATKNMDELSARGYVTQSKDILENEVVLIKGKNTETPVIGFRNCYVAKSIAVGAPGVPAGDYARQIFDSLGIMSRVYGRSVNECPNVTAVLRSVAEGANEVGIVYKTDALTMKNNIDIIETAAADIVKSRVIYPAGIIKNTLNDEVTAHAVSHFYEFLSSPEGRGVFMRYGFTAIRPQRTETP